MTIGPALAARLRGADDAEPIPVLITHAADADLDSLAAVALDEVRYFTRIRTIACTLPASAVRDVAGRPDVDLVDLDDQMHAL